MILFWWKIAILFGNVAIFFGKSDFFFFTFYCTFFCYRHLHKHIENIVRPWTHTLLKLQMRPSEFVAAARHRHIVSHSALIDLASVCTHTTSVSLKLSHNCLQCMLKCTFWAFKMLTYILLLYIFKYIV